MINFSIRSYCPDLLSLSQLPGVDANDPALKDLLASLENQSEVCIHEPYIVKPLWVSGYPCGRL